MAYGTYTCRQCGKSTEYKKQYGIDFPEKIQAKCKDRECLNDHEDFEDYLCEYFRNYGKITFAYDVAAGTVGNAKNGYENTIGSYIPSTLTRGYVKSQGDSSWDDNGY